MVNRQQFDNSFYQDIRMVRGDTMGFNFRIRGLQGVMPNTVTFACAEKYDENPIFTSSLGDGINLLSYDAEEDLATYAVSVSHEKTASMDVGRYLYDLQMTMTDNVLTLMRGNLDLEFEITR